MTSRAPRLLLRGEREQAIVNRVVTRSRLNDLRLASALRQVIAAAAIGDEQASLKILQFVDLYAYTRCRGEDLDERLVDLGPSTGGEFQPRRVATPSAGALVLTRASSIGTRTIAAGYRAQRAGVGRPVTAVTTSDAAFADGRTTTDLVGAATEQTGSYTETEPGAFTRPLSRETGIIAVSNPVPFVGGVDQERDEELIERARQYIRSLSVSTLRAIEVLARQVVLEDGRRVVVAKAYERADQPGRGTLWIDDGTGGVADNEVHALTGEVLVTSALGGEADFQTLRYPIVESARFELRINGVPVPTKMYALMYGPGTVRLSEVSFPSGLAAGDELTADYSYYTGLLAEVQWRLDGRPDDPVRYPGWRAFGAHLVARPPRLRLLTVRGGLVLEQGRVRADAVASAKLEVSRLINRGNVGVGGIRNEIIERIMGVPGVIDLALEEPTANVPVAADSVLRIRASGLQIF